MSEEVKKNDAGMARLAITLGAICAICALLLGMVNMFTEGVIADNQMREKMAAMQQVLPADDYDPATYTGADATILSAYKASNGGSVIEVDCNGGSFSGTLSIMVGIDADGTVTGVSILTTAETSGLGAKAGDPEFKDQFIGKSGSVAVDKDGGEISAISGATITSRAVCVGVSAALAAAAELG